MYDAGEAFERHAAALRAAGVGAPIEAVAVGVRQVREVTSPAYDAGRTEREIRLEWLDRHTGLQEVQMQMRNSGTAGEAPRVAWHRGEFEISTDRGRLDVDFIHRALSETYWARGIPRETVERSLEHSIVFGVYAAGRQIGLARVISDRATFAYLADVYIDPAYRGRGLGVWLVEVIRGHEELQKLRRWLLVTKDAHGLYAKRGFTSLAHPEYFMEVYSPYVP